MKPQDLKDFRAKYGLSQTKLGEILGRRQEAISQYENGVYDVPHFVVAVLEKWERDNVTV